MPQTSLVALRCVAQLARVPQVIVPPAPLENDLLMLAFMVKPGAPHGLHGLVTSEVELSVSLVSMSDSGPPTQATVVACRQAIDRTDSSALMLVL
jgi:hypothetical protein